MVSVQGVKSGLKKGLFVALALVLLVAGVAISWLYFGTFSEGVRAGVVMKVSKRGVLFKTFEAQLNLQGFGAVKSDNQLSETFEFSIEGSEEKLIKALEEVSLTGERINLNYVERYIVFPWRGETKYFATGIERKEKAEAEPRDTHLH